MKVLILADGHSWHTERFVNEMRQQGCEVLLATAEETAMTHTKLRKSRFGAYFTYNIAGRQVARLIRSFNPDIVSAHFATAYGQTLRRARSRLRHRSMPHQILWTLHVWGSDILVSPQKSIFHRWRTQRALRAADLLFADSTYLTSETRNLGAARVITIPWGVEERHFLHESAIDSKAKWRRPMSIILPRPHASLYRNTDIITALAPLVRDGHASLTVTTVGKELDTFREIARKLGIANPINYYEPLPRAEYLSLLGRHDICVSAAQSDSSPVTITECCARGVMPIAARHPGLFDFLPTSQPDMCLFEGNDAQGLLQAVTKMSNATDTEREQILSRNLHRAREVGVYEHNIAETLRNMRVALAERSVVA